jgi:hypothetical protein
LETKLNGAWHVHSLTSRLLTSVLSVILRVHAHIQGWASLSRTRAFIKQNEIKREIDDCYAELETCSSTFSVRGARRQTLSFVDVLQMPLDLHPSKSNESHAALEAFDEYEMRDTMADVLEDIGELKLVLSTYPPEDAEVVMHAIQEVSIQLRRCSLYLPRSAAQRRNFAMRVLPLSKSIISSRAFGNCISSLTGFLL